MKFILDEFGNKTRYKINKHGEVFDSDGNPVKISKITTRRYKGEIKPMKPRLYAIVECADGTKRRKQLARWMLLTYKPIKNSNKYEANHKDGDPENNELSNLEWLTRKENMKHAADNDLLPYGENHHNSKYPDKLIHAICQDICDGLGRNAIIEKHNINGQLIDDIKSGRSHKKISREYISKGFTYKIHDIRERLRIAEEICKLIVEGLTNAEIVEKLKLTNTCLPNDIRKRRVYKYISKKYGI